MNWKEISELQDMHIRNEMSKLSPEQRKMTARVLRILLTINTMIIGFLLITTMFYGLAQFAGYEIHITGSNHCCKPCNMTANCSLTPGLGLPLINKVTPDYTGEQEYYNADNKGI